MKAYKYLVPKNVKFKGTQYLVPGLKFGYKEIIAKSKVAEFEKYLVGEVEVADDYFNTKETPKTYTKDTLANMTYKEVQALAKSLGLKYKGKKKDIVERIVKAR